jgi:hypothetical protein
MLPLERNGSAMARTTSAGWLTLHEVLDQTGLPYRQIQELVDQGELEVRRSGSAELFDPDSVLRCGSAAGPSTAA